MPGAALTPARPGVLDLDHFRNQIRGLQKPLRRVAAGKHKMTFTRARLDQQVFHFFPLKYARAQRIERFVKNQHVGRAQLCVRPGQNAQCGFAVGRQIPLAPQKAFASGQKTLAQPLRQHTLLAGLSVPLHKLPERHVQPLA